MRRRAQFPGWLFHRSSLLTTSCHGQHNGDHNYVSRRDVKKQSVLDLLEGPLGGGCWGGGGGEVFRYIIILCPTIQLNKTYHNPEIFILDPGEPLHDNLQAFFQVFQGEPTLYLVDDCSATKALTRKKDMLSELAFSGRHADQTIWVLIQKYNVVLKDLSEQTHWVTLFHCKDCDSFWRLSAWKWCDPH